MIFFHWNLKTTVCCCESRRQKKVFWGMIRAIGITKDLQNIMKFSHLLHSWFLYPYTVKALAKAPLLDALH